MIGHSTNTTTPVGCAPGSLPQESRTVARHSDAENDLASCQQRCGSLGIGMTSYVRRETAKRTAAPSRVASVLLILSLIALFAAPARAYVEVPYTLGRVINE